jgi:hypothetical protein
MFIVKIQHIEHSIKNNALLQDIEDTLLGLENDTDKEFVRKWIFSKMDEFIERCKIVQEDDELPSLLMWFYMQLKTEWSQINTEVQYQPMVSDEPDMVLIFKASLLSQVIGNVETILRYVDVERAVNFMSNPVWKLESLDRFEVKNNQQNDLVTKSEDLQASQIQVLSLLKEVSSYVEGQKDSSKIDHEKIRTKLSQVENKFIQLTNNSNQLRLGISELRQTPAIDLYKRLERFYQDAQQSYGVWGEFSLSGGSILIERQTIDLLIEPYSQIIRMILNSAKSYDEQLDIRLRVRFAGRRLKTGIRVKSANKVFVEDLNQLKYSTVYQDISTLVKDIQAELKIVSKRESELEFAIERYSNSNVMEDSVIFDAGGIIAGIPRAFVGQLVSLNETTMKKVTTHQTLVHRDAVYPYLPMNALLDGNTDDKESVAILIDRNGKRLALGVSKVIGIETISLQPLGAYESESPMVQSIGMTGSGLILNFLSMGLLFDYDQIIKS